MAFFFFVLLAGFAWMGLRSEIGLGSFVTGCALGALTWRIERARSRVRFTPLRALRLTTAGARVLARFALELVVANWQQLRVVLSPRIEIQPCWTTFETELESPALRALLAVLICLTPGSLTCEEEIGEDGRARILIHVLDSRDPAADIARIRERLEAPLRALEQA